MVVVPGFLLVMIIFHTLTHTQTHIHSTHTYTNTHTHTHTSPFNPHIHKHTHAHLHFAHTYTNKHTHTHLHSAHTAKVCVELQAPLNGSIEGQNTSSVLSGAVSTYRRNYGALVRYRCRRGYSLNGTEFRKCLSSGHWSGSSPRCEGALVVVVVVLLLLCCCVVVVSAVLLLLLLCCCC